MQLIIGFILLIINIPVYKRIFRLIFRNTDDFRESVKYSFTPDIFSLFKGNYFKDRIGEAKLSFLIFCCAAVLIIEFVVINAIINFFT